MSVAPNGWTVVRAPLAGERQGHGCREGHVYIVDLAVPAEYVSAVVDQLVAATEGRWEDAPHAARPEPTLVHSAGKPERRSRRRAPVLHVVR